MYKKKQEYLDTIWEEERMPEYFHFDDYRVNLEDIPLVTTGDVISSINSSREDIDGEKMNIHSLSNAKKRTGSPHPSSNVDTIKDVVGQKEVKEAPVRVEQKISPDSTVVNKPKKASGRRKASGLSGIRMKKEFQVPHKYILVLV